ncbi:MAG: ABC transporter ATP-binding protein [Actinomycetota bacterium]|nr:ABC transporter ATP-binding protein [Actinomycetota bacterium]
MSASVEARGIRKEYGDLVAVEDLTFAVERGQILGVLGPNGAGKTTAIRVLTTILTPTRGTFVVAGVPHMRPADIRRRIGVLPESAGYPERQTGEEYLRYHARLYGHGKESARAVADALLAEAGLRERGRSPIGSYSRGMRQRLGIARALVNEPQVVFLDEPTLGLDPAGQRQVLALVRRIARERGATVLLSTHLLAEVEETCSRVLILNRGRVAAEGTVAEVSRQAAAPRSARLRVSADTVPEALRILASERGIRTAEPADGQPGTLALTLDDDQRPGLMNAALGALADAGVPVLFFELEGARLSDAFLAMTEAA